MAGKSNFSLFDVIESGLMVLSSRGDLVYANPFSTKLFNIKAQKFPEKIQESFQKTLRKIKKIKKTVRVDVIEIKPKTYIGYTAFPYEKNGMIVNCRDVSHIIAEEEYRKQYIKEVQKVTRVAAKIEHGNYHLMPLKSVMKRKDELGQLARVFFNVAREVKHRVEYLEKQVQDLVIEIDDQKRKKEVAAITKSDFFKDLKNRADELRDKVDFNE